MANAFSWTGSLPPGQRPLRLSLSGPLMGTAMVSGQTGHALRQIGLEPFPTDRLLERLPELLNPVEACIACVAADWPRFAELYCSQRPTHLFDPVLADAAMSRPTPPPAAAPHDITQTGKQPQQSPRDWLAATMSAVLHLPPDRLVPDIPLPMLGLDSLLAMEVRTRIERELGLTIGLSDLLGSNSLNDLEDRSQDLPADTGTLYQATWIAGQI